MTRYQERALFAAYVLLIVGLAAILFLPNAVYGFIILASSAGAWGHSL